MKEFLKPKPLALVLIIGIMAAIRLLPHPPNFTPIAAMALFGGAYFSNRLLAFLVPLGAMVVSDLLLGFHGITMIAVYFSFILTVVLGILLRKKPNLLTIPFMAIVSAVLFYLVTNFAVWIGSPIYPQDFSGLLGCYLFAIPFFHYTVLGNLVFTSILFGGVYLVSKKFPVLALDN
jgi:hypothetical protein